MLYSIEKPLFLHSEVGTNLSSVTGSFDKFRVQFDPPLKVPRDAIQPKLALTGFDGFYTYPNLQTGSIVFTATGSSFGTASGVEQTIPYPKGLYSLATLNETISAHLVGTTIPSTAWSFAGNTATQKVSIVATLAAGETIIFNVAATSDELWVLLGFKASLSSSLMVSMTGVANIPTQTVTAANVARFGDALSHINVHTSLASGAINANGNASDIVAAIVPPIPGSHISHQPPFPIHTSCEHLRGSIVNSATFHITNQVRLPLDTNGDHWSLQLMMTYSDETPEDA
jgi:hypothetical protein